MPVSVNTKLSGARSSSPQSYTPTTFTPSTNATINYLTWYQEDKFLVIDARISWSTTGAAGSVILGIDGIPGSPQIDTTWLNGTNGDNSTDSHLGDALWYDAGVGWKAVWITYNNATSMKFATSSQILAGTQMGALDNLKIAQLRLPIVGWG